MIALRHTSSCTSLPQLPSLRRSGTLPFTWEGEGHDRRDHAIFEVIGLDLITAADVR